MKAKLTPRTLNAVAMVSLALGLLCNLFKDEFPPALVSPAHFTAGLFLGISLAVFLTQIWRQFRSREGGGGQSA